MVTRPDDLIEDFIKAGATGITFHSEVVHHLQRSLRRIKDAGLKAGVAVNPATDFAHLEWVLDDLDLILSMTVNPGFGGQSLIPAALEKTKRIDQFLKEKSVREKIKIQIDGGANKETAREAKKAGVDILVAGSYIFGSDSYSTAIAELKG